jgi:hypothetical protein
MLIFQVSTHLLLFRTHSSQINTKYLHINNYFFSLGDDVIAAYISGIQFLPVTFSSFAPQLNALLDVYHVHEIMP